jgi:UDP-N-acetylmuramate--alanine ligase
VRPASRLVRRQALESVGGADRRFPRKGEASGILVVDDYVHHPTEIKATLAAARAGFHRRLVAVFQPHRFTRVRDLMDQFASSFNDASVVMVTDIYPAGEEPIAGITGQEMAAAIRTAGHPDVRWVGNVETVPEALTGAARDGDLVLTLGAGSVTRVGDRFLERLRRGETL